MGRSRRRSPRTLGVIWPDDGRGLVDYEWLRLNRWLADHGIDLFTTRIERSAAGASHVADDLFVTGSLDHLLPPARRLAEAGSEALLWACTSGSFIGGLAWARNQAKALTDATGLPATSTTLSLIEAARAMEAERLDILGAYPEPVTTVLAQCLRDAGFAVEVVVSLESPHGRASFDLDLMGDVGRFRRQHPNHDYPLVIPDTAINTLDLVEALERVAGRPVITANQASLWSALGMLGLRRRVTGPGSLFRRADAAAAQRPPR